MNEPFARYPLYKSTDEMWLPTVPQGWKLIRGKRLFASRREGSYAGAPQLAASQRYGVVPQERMIQLHGAKVMLAMGGTKLFRRVVEGDFVISLRSFEGGIEYSNYGGCISPAYTVLTATQPIIRPYYRYLLKCVPFVAALQSATNSLRDGKAITFTQFGSIQLPAPPLKEQTHIAVFLDRETARLDNLIDKQQQLIALLQEKSQAVIDYAITQGCNSDAPLRPSGIPWLGQVPAHWHILRIKNLAQRISKGTTPSTMGLKMSTAGVRFIKGENVGKHIAVSQTPEFYISKKTDQALSRSRLQFGDVLVIIAGATTGLCSIVDQEMLPANTNQAVSFIRPSSLAHSHLIARWLSTEFAQRTIWMAAVQAAQPNLSMGDLGRIPIAVPPKDELVAILEYIDSEEERSQALVKKARAVVRLLKERRTTVISAAVTGEIDVQPWTPFPENAS